MFLFMVSYCGYIDFFTATDFSDAEKKARILSCNTGYTLKLITTA